MIFRRFDADENKFNIIPLRPLICWSLGRDSQGRTFSVVFNLTWVRKLIPNWIDPATFLQQEMMCSWRYCIRIRKSPHDKKYFVTKIGAWSKV